LEASWCGPRAGHQVALKRGSSDSTPTFRIARLEPVAQKPAQAGCRPRSGGLTTNSFGFRVCCRGSGGAAGLLLPSITTPLARTLRAPPIKSTNEVATRGRGPKTGGNLPGSRFTPTILGGVVAGWRYTARRDVGCVTKEKPARFSIRLWEKAVEKNSTNNTCKNRLARRTVTSSRPVMQWLAETTACHFIISRGHMGGPQTRSVGPPRRPNGLAGRTPDQTRPGNDAYTRSGKNRSTSAS